MPYFRDKNLDDQQNQQAGQGVQLSGGTNTADPDGGITDNTAPKSANTGSHFQNLDKYLQNNDAAGFGKQFGSNVQKSIDDAKSTVDTTVGDVKNQINGGAAPSTQEQVQGAINSAGTLSADDQAKAAKQYQDWTNQSYQGPKSLADVTGADNKIQGGISAANTKAKLAGTESGRFSLLDQYFGRPSYNFGEKSLDNLLVERGGGFQNQPDLQNQAAQLSNYGAQQAQDIQNAASQRAGQFDAAKAQARSAIGLQDDNTIQGGPLQDIQDKNAQAVKDYNDQQAQQLQEYQRAIAGDKINSPLANMMGLQAGTQIYNTDLSKYLTPAELANKDTVANQGDYNKYMALAQLAGTNPGYFGESDAANIGKPTAGIGYNTAGALQGITDTAGEYNRLSAEAQQGHPYSGYESTDALHAAQQADIANAMAKQKYLDQIYTPNKRLGFVGGNASLPKDYGSVMKGLR